MSLRFHEIAEADHRILNPFNESKLDLLGELAGVCERTRHLDVACGKGEMLCRWARDHGSTAVGVDLGAAFLDASRTRARELGVDTQITFVESEGAAYLREDRGVYDVVSCIGATWIGNGLEGTLDLMRPRLRNGGTILVGEPFWNEPPPPDALAALTGPGEEYVSLVETLGRFETADFDLVEMLAASHDDWDRYEASQWRAGAAWLEANPDDADAEAFADWLAVNRRTYLAHGRRYMGWAVFVLRDRRKG